jgi:hypothetical protein
MKMTSNYFHCGDLLKNALNEEISEVKTVVSKTQWLPEFEFDGLKNQRAYNRAFDVAFGKCGWEAQPLLRDRPRLIGDFRKGLVFVEIQFGNSSSLYRDFYKFQYGLANGLLSLAVLVVPTNPPAFFSGRGRSSVSNMAEYTLAHTILTILPVDVPVLLIGLLPEN